MSVRLQLEEKVLRYLQNKEIAKERTEENKLLLEEIETMTSSIEEERIVIDLPNGDVAVITAKFHEKEVLDKDLLAEEMQVPKHELKTPFDFSMFTAQGKLSPAMITKHTSIVRDVKITIVRRKVASRKWRKK